MHTDGHALARAARVAERLGIAGDPVRHGDGWSNHTWLYADAVIRIAMEPGSGALAVEVGLAPALPAAVGYPRLLGSGVIDGHEWMAQERLPGDNLARLWGPLTSAQRGYAVTDLCARLAAVPSADTSGLTLPATPLYAFDAEAIGQQLAAARPLVGAAVTARAGDLVRAGLAATRMIHVGLVHTDAVLTNVVWTGSSAIPIDFEFACVGPADLDADCVGREVVGRGDPTAISALHAALRPILARRGALDRLRGYTVLRDLWAVGKWIEHDPTLSDAQTWEPVLALIDDTERSGWIDRLLAAED